MQFSKDERQVFHVSTMMVLGDVASALFWQDRWIGKTGGLTGNRWRI
jgi:hypothetical protein